MKKWMAVLFVTMALASCARKPVPYNDSEFRDSAKEQIASFENELRNAKAIDAQTIAKDDFDKAVAYFEEAKEEARKGTDMDDFRKTMHKARGALDRARDKAEQKY